MWLECQPFLYFGPLNKQERAPLAGVWQGLCLKSSKNFQLWHFCWFFPVFFIFVLFYVVWIPFSSEHVHGISLSLCVCWRPKMRRESRTCKVCSLFSKKVGGDVFGLTMARWRFQIFFIFTPIWGRFPFWLIFFKWVETTNQMGKVNGKSHYCNVISPISHSYHPLGLFSLFNYLSLILHKCVERNILQYDYIFSKHFRRPDI